MRYTPINQTFPRYSGAQVSGYVTAVGGPLITAVLPYSSVGDICKIQLPHSEILAQLVSFKDQYVKLAPLDSVAGVTPGAAVYNTGFPLTIFPPHQLLGKVIDVLGHELECGKSTDKNKKRNLICVEQDAPEALQRPTIQNQLITGVKCIDAFCPIGYGQRMGLLAGPGVGKSTLLGMIASHAKVDVTVIALVGERSREIPDFIQDVLGDEGLKKAVVVAAASDESAARRKLAPFVATAIAEHFRDQGKNVLLLVDSLTRTARALREVGLAAGEIPVRQGFPASVYAELPKLLERAGTSSKGSITGIYTILTQNDQSQDALGEELKSLLDGHIVLDPYIAEKGLLPAFDITTSISRLQNKLLTSEEFADLKLMKAVASNLKRNKDIILFGGTPDPELKAAMQIEKELDNFIAQTPQDPASQDFRQKLHQLVEEYRNLIVKT